MKKFSLVIAILACCVSVYAAGIQGTVTVPYRGTASISVAKVDRVMFKCQSTMRVSFDNNTTSKYMELKETELFTSSSQGRNQKLSFGRISTISKASKTCRYRGI